MWMALLLAASALEPARAALHANRLDELVFLLQAKDAVAAEEQKDAAALLAEAAVKARAKKDKVLALQLAQMAVKRDAGEPRALELLTSFALADKELGQALRYARQWVKEQPDDERAKKALARAEDADKNFRPIPIVELHPRRRDRQRKVARAADAELEPASGEGHAQSAHFRVSYSKGARDWAERARYEVTALQVMERAWVDARGQLGEGLTGPYDVVLYTRDEFAAQFGLGAARGVLGFYSGKIRMNLSDRMDESYQATALHELVHAALDLLANGNGHELPYWLNEGLARWVERKALSGDFLYPAEQQLVARRGHELPLAQLAGTSFINLGPATALGYSKSAAAVQALIGRGEGLVQLTRLTRALGNGQSFERAFAAEFGARRLQTLDEESIKACAR